MSPGSDFLRRIVYTGGMADALDRSQVVVGEVVWSYPGFLTNFRLAAANSLAVADRTPESHFDGEARSEG